MDLELLIRHVATSPRSSFYREWWKGETRFDALPSISRAEFVRVPLSLRRYKDEKSLGRIVGEATPFVSEWSFEDIAAEPLTLTGIRPLVYFSDPHEAIEKSLWCYEQNIVPLIGEMDPDIAMFAAAKYQVDSMIVDAASLQALRPYLEERRSPVREVIVLGASFDTEALMWAAPLVPEVRLVLRTPETGVYAAARLSAQPLFMPLAGCLLEHGAELLVTKQALLITPAIRYRTTHTSTPEGTQGGFYIGTAKV